MPQIIQPWKSIHRLKFEEYWPNLCSSLAEKKEEKKKKRGGVQHLCPVVSSDKITEVGDWHCVLWTILHCSVRNMTAAWDHARWNPSWQAVWIFDSSNFKESHNQRTGRYMLGIYWKGKLAVIHSVTCRSMLYLSKICIMAALLFFCKQIHC